MNSHKGFSLVLLMVLLSQLIFATDFVVAEDKFPISQILSEHFDKELLEGQFIKDVKLSTNGRVVALLVFENFNGGSNYSKIIVAHITKAQGKVLSEVSYLPETEFQTNAGQPFVIELGQISNKCDKILLRVGIKSARVAPYKVTYYWQTREVPSGRVLNSNLNGKAVELE